MAALCSFLNSQRTRLRRLLCLSTVPFACQRCDRERPWCIVGLSKTTGVDAGGVYFQSVSSLTVLLLPFLPSVLPIFFFTSLSFTALRISFYSLLHLLPQTTVTLRYMHCDELIAVSSSECDGSPVLWSINRLFKTLQRDTRVPWRNIEICIH